MGSQFPKLGAENPKMQRISEALAICWLMKKDTAGKRVGREILCALILRRKKRDE
jgi:hypothetical protein